MKAASSLFEWLQGFFINLLDTDKFLIKSLHIVTYFIIGNAGVNLRGFYIGVSQHFADRFDGNTTDPVFSNDLFLCLCLYEKNYLS